MQLFIVIYRIKNKIFLLYIQRKWDANIKILMKKPWDRYRYIAMIDVKEDLYGNEIKSRTFQLMDSLENTHTLTCIRI